MNQVSFLVNVIVLIFVSTLAHSSFGRDFSRPKGESYTDMRARLLEECSTLEPLAIEYHLDELRQLVKVARKEVLRTPKVLEPEDNNQAYWWSVLDGANKLLEPWRS